MARDIATREGRREEEAWNDQPRVAGRQADGPRYCGDGRGAVIFAHAIGWSAWFASGVNWG